MSSSWKYVKLGDISKVQTGPFGSQLHQKDYVDGGIPLVTVKNLGQRRINRHNLDGVSDDDAKRLTKYTLRVGDVVFSRVGAYIDKSSIVTEEENGWIFSSSTLMARPNTSLVDPWYLIYYLNSPPFKRHIRNVAVGATRPSLNTTILSDSEVHLPSLPEQKRIAHILRKLDDKIELNRQMNQTLESMVQALFKSWFVDFDPVLDNALAAGHEIPGALQAKAEKRQLVAEDKKLIHTNSDLAAQFPDAFVYNETLGKWIPEGWSLLSIGELAEVIDPHPSHRAPQVVDEGFPFAGIGDIEPSGKIKLDKARVIGEEYVLKQEQDYSIGALSVGYGRVGTVGKVVRLRKQNYKYALSPTLAVINTRNPRHGEFIFFMVKSKQFFDEVLQNMTGTTRPTIGIQVFRKLSLVLPNIDSEILNQFGTLSRPAYKKTDNLNLETETLIQLRDTLLPQLITGKVRVPEGEVENMTK